MLACEPRRWNSAVPQCRSVERVAELRLVLTACALLAAMMMAAAIGARQRIGSLLLALLSFVWLSLDHRFEGPVIIRLSSHNGVVAADLVGVLGISLAGWLWWRARG